MKNVVEPAEGPGFFDEHLVARLFHHTDEPPVAAGVGADGAGVAFRKGEAVAAEMNGPVQSRQVLGQVVLFVIGSKVMSRWFRMVAKRKSSELFMINVLLVTLGVAYLTELEGLSMALGAFVAGMLLSETEYRFQVEDDIRPFRDILLGFFFITVGMKLDIQALIGGWQQILILLAILLVLKALVVFFIRIDMSRRFKLCCS